MEQYIVTAEKMVYGGDCLCKINGKNVFIPFVIPGEKVKIEILKSYRDYDLARPVEILEPSFHRVKPVCPLYTVCGGCNMQHISADFQRELRVSMLKESFTREGIVCPEIQVISGNDFGYRGRIQLTDGSFNRKNSNETVCLDYCPVATKEINSYLKSTPQNLRPKGRVHIFADERVTDTYNSPFSKTVIADEKENNLWLQKTVGKSSRKLKNKVQQRFAGTVNDSSSKCSVLLNGKTLQFDVKGFFQSNLEVLEKTIQEVKFNMGGENLLDMYSGCGTFSVFLGNLFNKTYLVEHNRDALVNAEINMAGINHESYGVSGERWTKVNAPVILSKCGGRFDAVVIDPPRSGMEKEVSDWLCKNKTGQIRSISCNSSTHARDAKKLIQAGYRLTGLFLLDFYPQTSHIESLACFEYTE